MNTSSQLTDMILQVANALGPDLLDEVAFVGGCTTALHLTDDFTKENVRFTDDVDLIINVTSYVDWSLFVEKLKPKGFRSSMEDDVMCRLRLGELIVDFMPDDEDILGFSNRWYKDALKLAEPYPINKSTNIRLITPPYFIATKLEAYNGRGNNDPLGSRDIEDILNLVDGREELIDEIANSPLELKEHISNEISLLLDHDDFEYAVQSTAKGDSGRIEIIFERLDALKALTYPA